MDRKLKWRSFWLAVLAVFALLTLMPTLVPSEKMPPWLSGVFNRKVQLGLDLQGGLHIVYSIDLQKAVDDKATEIKRDLESKLDEIGVKGRATTPRTPRGAVSLILESADDLPKLGDAFFSDYDEIVVARECPENEAKARSRCVRVSSDYADSIKKSALEQAIRTVRDRIDEKGVVEPTVISKGDNIIVELPGLDKVAIARVKDLIERTAKLEFKIVDENSVLMREVYRHVGKDDEGDAVEEGAKALGIKADTEVWTHDESGKQFQDYFVYAEDRTELISKDDAKERGCYRKDMSEVAGKVECKVTGRVVLEEYLESLAAIDNQFQLDDDHQFGFELIKPENTSERNEYWRTYYLYRAVELGGSMVSKASVGFNPTSNRPEVLVDFTRLGGRRFGELTGKNVGRKMAIILDAKVNSAPTIQTKIDGGRSSITMGGGTRAYQQSEAEDLVNVLRTGSLPAPLKEESSSEVGPLLGQDAIDKAVVAFGLGALLVMVIMVGYYRTSGAISIAALTLNIGFMMALLAGFGATLTLPGVAALVLTVGMAVDANIIIYERIREELRTGKSVKGAVDAGFSRGFSAILDGQLTTGVAAYVLYQFGSGPIRGFAVMLLIGIVCTLFTATWCTRLFFEYYVGRGRKAPVLAI